MTDRLFCFFFCLCLICLSASAQQKPGNPPPQANVAARKAASERFIAGREVTTGAAANLMHARQQHAKLLAHGAAVNLSQPWQSVGPAQVTTQQYGLVTGRVSSIAADPSDPTGNTVYVGTTGGGIWKSTNAAGPSDSVAFAPLTDTLPVFSDGNLASLSIGALSVQPGGTGVLLAGTGDPNDALDSYYGSGLLRSTDGGVTWSLITNSKDGFSGGSQNFYFMGLGFSGFAWGTASPNFVVAAVSDAEEGSFVNAEFFWQGAGAYASQRGLYYSRDAGQTWFLATITDGPGQVLQTGTQYAGSLGNAATSVVWNPARQRFFAAIRYHGYYESSDGITWTRLANQPGAGLNAGICPANPGGLGSTACPIYRGVLAVQPATGDTFALTVDINNLDQGLWQDVCGLSSGVCSSGAVQFANQLSSTALEAGNGDTTIPNADYNLALAAVASAGDTLLFVGTQDLYKCSLAAGCVWRNTTNTASCAAAGVAPSQHSIDASLTAPPLSLGVMYFGNDSGLWRTADQVNQSGTACSSDDAAHFQNLNGSLGSLAEVDRFAQDPNDGVILLAGLGENGTAAATSAGQQVWPQVLGGYGDYVAIDQTNSQYWYAESTGGVGIQRCTQGASCSVAGFGTEPAIGYSQVGYDAYASPLPLPFILDPQDSSQIIVGTCRIWRGNADGTDWSNANLLSTMLDGDQGPFCNGNGVVSSLSASGTLAGNSANAELIYAGMAGEGATNPEGFANPDNGGLAAGSVFLQSVPQSATAGVAPTQWSDLANSPVVNDPNNFNLFNPQNFAISSVLVDTHDATGQTVYAAVQGFATFGADTPLIYSSTDAGAHWTNISSNLPNAPVNSVVVDPNDANTVYVALDTGVYVTTSVTGCSTENCWSVFGAGLPNSPVTEIAAINGGGVSLLRAATYGRGIWQIPLVTASSEVASATVSPGSIIFGAQGVQTQSESQPVVISNTGSVALAITRISVTGDFSETDNCAAPVLPGATCTVEVSFVPTAAGGRTGTVTIYANVAGGQLTAALSGTGTPGPAIVISPLSVNFGTELIGTVAAPAQNITISNTGPTTIALQSPAINNTAFQIAANTCGVSLPPDTGCTIALTFTPAASGTVTGSFSITDSVGTQTVTLTGSGISPATDVVSPTSLTFAPQVVGTSSAAQQITLTNSGDQTLLTIAVQVSGDFGAVNSCGESLIGHASCNIAVNYVPTQVGAEKGTITVTDIYGKPQTISLSGTGLAPAGVSALPSALNFGGWGVSSTSTPSNIVLTNNGGVSLSAPTVSVTGNYAVASNGCTGDIAPGANCVVGITFSPVQPGSVAGTLRIASRSLSEPFQIPLSGTGVQFAFQVGGSSTATVTSGQTASYSLQIIPAQNSSAALKFSCTGLPANSNCTLSPATLEMTAGVTGFVKVSVATGVAPSSAFLLMQSSQWLALVVPFSLVGFRRRSRTRRAWSVLAASAILIGLSACSVSASPGSGASSGTGSSPSDPNPTPSGTYTITVTATGQGINQSVQLTLIVE